MQSNSKRIAEGELIVKEKVDECERMVGKPIFKCDEENMILADAKRKGPTEMSSFYNSRTIQALIRPQTMQFHYHNKALSLPQPGMFKN
jgi:hypothetical protein